MATDPAKLEVSLLGELQLRHAGRPLVLPGSRKTRAIFVYLLLCGKAVRRERLCELFFDLPDDPRAALRWSLSKIRQMLGPFGDLLRTEREMVSLHTACIVTDVGAMGDRRAEAGELAERAELAMETPLAGLDIAGLEGFAAWLAAERARIDRVRASVLRRAAAEEALSEAQRRMFAGAAEEIAPHETGAVEAPPERLDQQVRFCAARDGVRIAYACTGEGPALVKAANWLNHLELDWTGPIWGWLIAALSRSHKLVRYDERGNGLSQWDVEDLGFEAFVTDLETVVEALGLSRFPLLGISQGCAVSIAYAARHPERVEKLILLGGYSAGWRHFADESQAAQREAVITLAQHGWGQDNPVYRQIFSQTFMPAGTAEELAWFNEYQRRTASPENAVRFLETFSRIDVRPLLGQVRCPTLVLHARGDQRVPLAQAIELAAGIEGARLVTFGSDNHLRSDANPPPRRSSPPWRSF